MSRCGVGGVRRRSFDDLCDEMAELWHRDKVRYFYIVDEHILPYDEGAALDFLDTWQRGLERRGRVVAQRDVERLGGHVVLGQVHDVALGAGRDAANDRSVSDLERHEPVQLHREGLRLLGQHVEPEGLHGHEPIAAGLVGAKDRSEDADSDLMQNSERPECSGRRERRRVVVRQRRNSSGGLRDANTDRPARVGSGPISS